MKKTKRFVGLTLLSMMALNATAALAAPGATEGAPAKRNTDAVIKFKENDDSTQPVDPIDPDIPVIPVDPVDPDNPVEPGTGGPLSLDYASALNFGEQKISSKDETYYAATQEVIIEGVHSQKPLYAQVTDNRGSLEGWTLSVAQNGQFMSGDKELTGAKISFYNGQKATVSASPAPGTVNETVVLPIDGSSMPLMEAQNGQGAGTWIYRMGDLDTMNEGVELSVPGATMKLKDAEYKTTLTWSLSVLPGTGEGE